MDAPDALYTAVAAVVVAVIGVLGNAISQNRKRGNDDVEAEAVALETDLNVIRALSTLLDQSEQRRVDAERRLAACEAREQVREQ